MRTATETITTINLDHDQMFVFDGGHGGRVRVLYGAAWLTQEHETDDTILQSGGEAALRKGRKLIEGLEPTRVQIIDRAADQPVGSSTNRTSTQMAWWHRAARSLRQHIVRLQLGPTTA